MEPNMMIVSYRIRQLLLAGTIMLLSACASSSGTGSTASDNNSAAAPDPRQQRICENIEARLASLGVNTTGDPFRWPGYRNREYGDPDSPGGDIARLQMAYQRNRCYMLRTR